MADAKLLAILEAYDRRELLDALKVLVLKERRAWLEAIRADGWTLFDGSEADPRLEEKEWFKTARGRIYFRTHRHDSSVRSSSNYPKPEKREQAGPTRLSCPKCGAIAYAQSVCPKCSKGKAGIRKMWICGENSDHVFYTER
jgi:hypothetical protein